MNLSELIPETHYIQINLSDLLDQLGEDEVKEILSTFSCPINADVEKFLKEKAIEFSKREFSKTHLVFWETENKEEKEFVGYYTIAYKHITIDRKAINYKEARKLREHGIYNEKSICRAVPTFIMEKNSSQVVPDCYHDPKMWWEVHGPDDGGAGSGRRMGTDRCRHASGIWRRERMFMCDKVIQEIIRQPLTNPP